jgi:molecular chaperone Hsp33
MVPAVKPGRRETKLAAGRGEDDLVLSFRLERFPVRGRLVRLGPAIDGVLSAHDYPAPVSALLGEALVVVAMLGPTLKFEGVITLQLQGDGPIATLVADFATPGALRGYAAFDSAALGALEPERVRAAPIPSLLGEGVLAFTLDPRFGRERYQSVVPLEGHTLAHCARAYFLQSEQLPTALKLAVARHYEPRAGIWGRWRAGGLLTQRMPDAQAEVVDEAREDMWRYAEAVVATLSEDELVDPMLAPAEQILRLFPEEDVRVYSPKRLHFACRCSEARLSRVLGAYSEGERARMVEADGAIHARCEFCSRLYKLDPRALAAPV